MIGLKPVTEQISSQINLIDSSNQEMRARMEDASLFAFVFDSVMGGPMFHCSINVKE